MITKISKAEAVRQKAEDFYDYGKNIRAHLHKYPELSNKEFNTSRFLKKQCEDMGLEIYEIEASTAFVARLSGNEKGKSVGIRTDIDALPIKEDMYNLSKERSYISKNDGVMHACGHDGHMAIALTSTKILSQFKDILKGDVYFIFERAEETCEGSYEMVEFLKDKNIDAIYGNHLDPKLPIGKVNIGDGVVQAGSMGIDFDLYGKEGHGSRPDKSISPIQAMVKIVDNLESIWLSNFDPRDNISLSIGSINAGSAPNIIPDKANLKGTARFIKNETGEVALELLKDIVESTAKLYSCKIEFNDYTKIVTYPTINDDFLGNLAKDSASEVFDDILVDKELSFGSETFSAYSRLCPIVFIQLGIKNLKYGSGSDIHTRNFDLDPRIIFYGSALASNFALNFLNN